MPGSVSIYSTLTFGIVYGSCADPSTEMKSTPFGGSAPIRFISDCCTIRCMNATGLPAGSSGAPHADVRHRTVEVVLHVVFAGPHDFHRLADGLRRFHRVGDEVGFAAPAEPAAEIRRVDLDLVGRKAAGRDRRLMRSRLSLCRHPHVAAVRTDLRRAVHRLHRRVRQERHFKYALERARVTALQRGRHVAVVAGDLARAAPRAPHIFFVMSALFRFASAPSFHLTVSAWTPLVAAQ